MKIAPEIRQFLTDAFDGDFSDEDFENALGGIHFVTFRDDRLVAHASVVSRFVNLDDLRLEVGYVEAMAVHREWRGRGLGAELLAGLTAFCRQSYRASMLSTDIHAFYEKHGWLRLGAESFVETESGLVRTEDDDEGLMLLTDGVNLAKARRAVCDFRSGDVW